MEDFGKLGLELGVLDPFWFVWELSTNLASFHIYFDYYWWIMCDFWLDCIFELKFPFWGFCENCEKLGILVREIPWIIIDWIVVCILMWRIGEIMVEFVCFPKWCIDMNWEKLWGKIMCFIMSIYYLIGSCCDWDCGWKSSDVSGCEVVWWCIGVMMFRST